MKRHGNFYARICDADNLRRAAWNAARGKRNRREVRAFFADLEAELATLRSELLTGSYRTSAYEIFEKVEEKRRIIYKLPFRDRVVQWAIMQVLEPIWTPQFTADTHACIRGRGMHSLLRKMRADLRDDPEGTAYCLKLDVRKFYPSIDHGTLKAVVRRKIKDPEVLALLDGIIDSAEGLPIGNYISQYLANLYLSELDHMLKEVAGVRYYYRYADDMVILAGDKGPLRGLLVLINDWLETERLLSLKGNYQIFPVESRGIDFVGYVTRHDYCLARKKNKKGLCRELAKLRKAGVPEAEIMLLTASRAGFMKHCDSKHLFKTLDMKKFSDLVPKTAGNLTGTKYHIDAILGREIHLTGYKLAPSKYNSDQSLTLQYSILEQVMETGPDGQRRPVIDDEGQPVTDWVQHITFTGSQALIRQLGGVEITEPLRAKIIKQPIAGPGNRCFYKIVDPDD
ncbi:MAG: reverse transcriptase/maturase family protein [Lachnospiraceae bacterium]|nr:reverse transcriptase/maturase family protein [Lachnospiraceae bacterium]